MPQKRIYQELAWDEVRSCVVNTCSKDLVSIMDEINPDPSYKFFKIIYPFGTQLVTDGLAKFPLNKNTLALVTDHRTSKTIRENLSYSSVPLGIIAKNSIEIYRKMEDRVFSLAVAEPGFDLGIWEYFGSTTPYSISSGARSLYMIPRISTANLHKRLKKEFEIHASPPKRLCDHWNIFTELYSNDAFSTEWNCEIIFLGKKWFDTLKSNKETSSGWLKLRNFILSKGWEHANFGRKQVLFDMMWQIAMERLNYMRLKINPYIIDSLKHLMFLFVGSLPGSAPYAGKNTMGPLDEIQKIYLDVYGLKEYIPTIMQPQYFVFGKSEPIYYSMQTPTLLESALKYKTATSNADDMRELSELISHFTAVDFGKHLKIDGLSINDIMDLARFEFFHGEMYAYGKIFRPTKEMPDKDQRLLYMPGNKSGYQFADNGAFVRGCIRISNAE